MPEKSKFIKTQSETKNSPITFHTPKSKADSSKFTQSRFAKQTSNVSIKEPSVKSGDLQQIQNNKILNSSQLTNKSFGTSSKFSSRQPVNKSVIPEIMERGEGRSSINYIQSGRKLISIKSDPVVNDPHFPLFRMLCQRMKLIMEILMITPAKIVAWKMLSELHVRKRVTLS